MVDASPIMGDGRYETPVQYPRPQAEYRHKGLKPLNEDETRETKGDCMTEQKSTSYTGVGDE